MAHDRGEMTDMPERYSISKAENGYVLEESGKNGMVSYVYDDVDDLLSALRDDLSGGKPEKKEKKTSEKMTSMEDEDEE